MEKPWYRKKPEQYEKIRQEIEDAYPELFFKDDEECDVTINGWYYLYEGGTVWDRYKLKVIVPKDSPCGLPTVYEIGNRIPQVPDRHMETNGKACIVLPDAFWYEYPDGMNLHEFLDGPLRHFLANQSLIDRGCTDNWKDGEWKHGSEGIIQFYSKIIGTDDPNIIHEYLKLMISDEIKGHWPCPCGSGERLRKCHKDLVSNLRRIPRDIAIKSIKYLQKTIIKDR
jgi:hypothetical protein